MSENNIKFNSKWESAHFWTPQQRIEVTVGKSEGKPDGYVHVEVVTQGLGDYILDKLRSLIGKPPLTPTIKEYYAVPINMTPLQTKEIAEVFENDSPYPLDKLKEDLAFKIASFKIASFANQNLRSSIHSQPAISSSEPIASSFIEEKQIDEREDADISSGSESEQEADGLQDGNLSQDDFFSSAEPSSTFEKIEAHSHGASVSNSAINSEASEEEEASISSSFSDDIGAVSSTEEKPNDASLPFPIENSLERLTQCTLAFKSLVAKEQTALTKKPDVKQEKVFSGKSTPTLPPIKSTWFSKIQGAVNSFKEAADKWISTTTENAFSTLAQTMLETTPAQDDQRDFLAYKRMQKPVSALVKELAEIQSAFPPGTPAHQDYVDLVAQVDATQRTLKVLETYFKACDRLDEAMQKLGDQQEEMLVRGTIEPTLSPYLETMQGLGNFLKISKMAKRQLTPEWQQRIEKKCQYQISHTLTYLDEFSIDLTEAIEAERQEAEAHFSTAQKNIKADLTNLETAYSAYIRCKNLRALCDQINTQIRWIPLKKIHLHLRHEFQRQLKPLKKVLNSTDNNQLLEWQISRSLEPLLRKLQNYKNPEKALLAILNNYEKKLDSEIADPEEATRKLAQGYASLIFLGKMAPSVNAPMKLNATVDPSSEGKIKSAVLEGVQNVARVATERLSEIERLSKNQLQSDTYDHLPILTSSKRALVNEQQRIHAAPSIWKSRPSVVFFSLLQLVHHISPLAGMFIDPVGETDSDYHMGMMVKTVNTDLKQFDNHVKALKEYTGSLLTSPLVGIYKDYQEFIEGYCEYLTNPNYDAWESHSIASQDNQESDPIQEIIKWFSDNEHTEGFYITENDPLMQKWLHYTVLPEIQDNHFNRICKSFDLKPITLPPTDSSHEQLLAYHCYAMYNSRKHPETHPEANKNYAYHLEKAREINGPFSERFHVYLEERRPALHLPLEEMPLTSQPLGKYVLFTLEQRGDELIKKLQELQSQSSDIHFIKALHTHIKTIKEQKIAFDKILIPIPPAYHTKKVRAWLKAVKKWRNTFIETEKNISFSSYSKLWEDAISSKIMKVFLQAPAPKISEQLFAQIMGETIHNKKVNVLDNLGYQLHILKTRLEQLKKDLPCSDGEAVEFCKEYLNNPQFADYLKNAPIKPTLEKMSKKISDGITLSHPINTNDFAKFDTLFTSSLHNLNPRDSFIFSLNGFSLCEIVRQDTFIPTYSLRIYNTMTDEKLTPSARIIQEGTVKSRPFIEINHIASSALESETFWNIRNIKFSSNSPDFQQLASLLQAKENANFPAPNYLVEEPQSISGTEVALSNLLLQHVEQKSDFHSSEYEKQLYTLVQFDQQKENDYDKPHIHTLMQQACSHFADKLPKWHEQGLLGKEGLQIAVDITQKIQNKLNAASALKHDSNSQPVPAPLATMKVTTPYTLNIIHKEEFFNLDEAPKSQENTESVSSFPLNLLPIPKEITANNFVSTLSTFTSNLFTITPANSNLLLFGMRESFAKIPLNDKNFWTEVFKQTTPENVAEIVESCAINYYSALSESSSSLKSEDLLMMVTMLSISDISAKEFKSIEPPPPLYQPFFTHLLNNNYLNLQPSDPAWIEMSATLKTYWKDKIQESSIFDVENPSKTKKWVEEKAISFFTVYQKPKTLNKIYAESPDLEAYGDLSRDFSAHYFMVDGDLIYSTDNLDVEGKLPTWKKQGKSNILSPIFFKSRNISYLIQLMSKNLIIPKNQTPPSFKVNAVWQYPSSGIVPKFISNSITISGKTRDEWSYWNWQKTYALADANERLNLLLTGTSLLTGPLNILAERRRVPPTHVNINPAVIDGFDTRELKALSSIRELQLQETLSFFTRNLHALIKPPMQKLLKFLILEPNLLAEELTKHPLDNQSFAENLTTFCKRAFASATAVGNNEAIVFILDLNHRLKVMVEDVIAKHPHTFPKDFKPDFFDSRKELRRMLTQPKIKPEDLANIQVAIARTYRYAKDLSVENAQELAHAVISAIISESTDSEIKNNELKEILIAHRHTFKNFVDTEKRDNFLNGLYQRFHPQSNALKWEGNFPTFKSSSNHVEIDLLQGTFREASGKVTYLPFAITSHKNFKQLFGNISFPLASKIPSKYQHYEAYYMLSPDGIEYQLIATQSKLFIQRKFGEEWFQLDKELIDSKNSGIPSSLMQNCHIWQQNKMAMPIPENSLDTHVDLIFTDAVTHKPLYSIELNKGTFNVLDTQGKVTRRTLVSLGNSALKDTFQRFEDPIWILATENAESNQIESIELPRYQLTFNSQTVDDKIQLHCAQFPGFILSQQQYIEKLADITNYIVLENSQAKDGPQKIVLFPNAPLAPVSNSFTRETFVDYQNTSNNYFVASIQPKTGNVIPQTQGGNIFLAMMFLWQRNYKSAFAILQKYHAQPKALEENSIKILHEIYSLSNKNHNFDPGATAIRLKAATMLIQQPSPSAQPSEAKPAPILDAKLVASDYGKYLESPYRGREQTLSKHEEKIIARYCRKILDTAEVPNDSLILLRMQELDIALEPEEINQLTAEAYVSKKKPISSAFDVSVRLSDPFPMQSSASFSLEQLFLREIAPTQAEIDKHLTIEKNLHSMLQLNTTDSVLTKLVTHLDAQLTSFLESMNGPTPTYEITDIHSFKQVINNMKTQVAALDTEITIAEHATLALANQQSTDPMQRSLLNARRLAGDLSPIDIKDSVYFYLRHDAQEMHKRNPALSIKEIADHHLAVQKLLLLTTRQQRLKNISNLMEEMAALHESGANPDLLKSFSQILAKEGPRQRAFDPEKNPACLVLEAETGHLLKQNQIDTVNILLHKGMYSDYNGLQKEILGIAKALGMGEGKSSVVNPLVNLYKADGTNLVISVMPRPLFESMSKEYMAKSEGAFRQHMDVMDFHRSSTFDADELTKIIDRLENVREDRRVLLMPSDSIQTLILKMAETLKDYGELVLSNAHSQPFSDEEQAAATEMAKQLQLYAKIFKIFKTYGVISIDEAHIILAFNKFVRFTVGEPQSISPLTARTTLNFYKFLEKRSDLRESLKFSFLADAPQTNPSAFSKEQYSAEMKPKLIDAILKGELVDEQHNIKPFLAGLDNQQRLLVYRFLDDKIDNEVKNYFDSIQNPNIQDTFALFKQLINEVLPYAATRKLFQHSGPQSPVKGLKDGEISDTAFLAKPYNQGEESAPGTQFATDITILGLSIQMFLEMARSEEDIHPLLTTLVAKEIEHQRNNAKTEMQTGKTLQDTKGDRAFHKMVDSLQYSLFDLTNEQIKEIAKNIVKDHDKLLTLIENQVVPQVKTYKTQLNANALIFGALLKEMMAISGTLWNADSFTELIKGGAIDSDTAAKTLYILEKNSSQEVNIVASPKDGSPESIHTTLLQMIADFNKATSIIDAANIFRGILNIEIAKQLWLIAQEMGWNKKGILFYNQANEIMVLTQSDTAEWVVTPKNKSPLAFESLLAFWDQPHTTGSDHKLDLLMTAVCTIGRDTLLSDLMQAAWRLRGLGEAQVLRFLALAEDENYIRMRLEKLGHPVGKELILRDLLVYTLAVQAERQGIDNYQAFKSKLYTILLEKAVVSMLEAETAEQMAKIYMLCRHLFEISQTQRPYELYGNSNQQEKKEIVVKKDIETFLNSPLFQTFANSPELSQRWDMEDIKTEIKALAIKELEKFPTMLSQAQVHNQGATAQTQQQMQTETQSQTQTQTINLAALKPQKGSEISPPPKVDWYRMNLFKKRYFEMPKLSIHLDSVSPHFSPLLQVSKNIVPVDHKPSQRLGNLFWSYFTKVSPPADFEMFSEYQTLFNRVLLIQDKNNLQDIRIIMINLDDEKNLKMHLQRSSLNTKHDPDDPQEVNLALLDLNLEKGNIYIQGSPTDRITNEMLEASEQYQTLIVQAKFFKGELNYSDKEISNLKKWLGSNADVAPDMHKLLTEKILPWRGNSDFYEGSDIAKIFAEFNL